MELRHEPINKPQQSAPMAAPTLLPALDQEQLSRLRSELCWVAAGKHQPMLYPTAAGLPECSVPQV